MGLNKRPKKPKRRRATSPRYEMGTMPPQYKRKLLTRKIKTKEIAIVTRKEQPVPAKFIYAEAKALSSKYVQGGMVSSSWISEVEWLPKKKAAFMSTINGWEYLFYIPFTIFEQWYYAHSKGTYFNYYVKDKYRYTRLKRGS